MNKKTAGLEERDIPYHHCHHHSLTIGVIVIIINNQQYENQQFEIRM